METSGQSPIHSRAKIEPGPVSAEPTVASIDEMPAITESTSPTHVEKMTRLNVFFAIIKNLPSLFANGNSMKISMMGNIKSSKRSAILEMSNAMESPKKTSMMMVEENRNRRAAVSALTFDVPCKLFK